MAVADTLSRLEPLPQSPAAHVDVASGGPETPPVSPVEPTPMVFVPDEHLEPAVMVAPPQQSVADEVVREETPAETARLVKPVLEFDWQSDLTQIETDREKLKAAQGVISGEVSAPPARKRERPPLSSVSNEPLIQVETGKPNAETERASAHQKSDNEAVSTATTN
jgi:hypothetical protein